MGKRFWASILLTGVAVVLGVFALEYLGGAAITRVPGFIGGDWIDFDDAGKSTNLPADLKLMWQTQPLRGTSDPTLPPGTCASTGAAVGAASRVFNTVELVGKTTDEVIALIGDPTSSINSVYNFPFYPAPTGSLVYRFDTGAGGWQFNVVFDSDGKVRAVERHGIE